MPAGYAATTNMESVFSAGFEFTAELSDLRVIERPSGRSRLPSNIVRQGDNFDLYADIHFVSVPGITIPPMPPVDIYVQYFLEGIGGSTAETQTGVERAVAGASLPPFNYALQVPMPADVINALANASPGVYKISATVYVVWEDGNPENESIMSGFIEGAPLHITHRNP